MKKQLNLGEVKQIELEILKYLDAFCSEHGIKYCVYAGTALGAVRHKGFIPWDDDIDVCMLRADYDCFRRVMAACPDSRYILLDPEENPNYLYPFLKIMDTGTELIEKNDMDCGVPLGVNIDVFPLDYVPDSEAEQKRLAKKLSFYKSGIVFSLRKVHLGSAIHKVTSLCLEIMLKLLGRNFFTRRLVSAIRKRCEYRSSTVQVITWLRWDGPLPVDIFDELTNVEFENNQFPIPVNYDLYLTLKYGDYMELPPEEKRVQYHGFTAYQL